MACVASAERSNLALVRLEDDSATPPSTTSLSRPQTGSPIQSLGTSHTQAIMLRALEVERNELGYSLEVVRGKSLRVVHRPCSQSNVSLFLVHGGGGRAGQFKHQIKALESQYNIVAMDFLGHGDSPKPDQPELYTADEHLEDLKGLFESHKKQKNVFVAHCYGAIHVLRLMKWLSTEDRLSEVAGLVILALGSNTPVSIRHIAKMPAFLLEWLRPLARSASNAAIFTPTTDPALIEFENSISNNNRMYFMKVLAADTSNQAVWDGWLSNGQQVLCDSSIPRAMICGDGDGTFSIASCQQVRGLLDIPEESFHVIGEAGHLAMLEKPDEVTRIIKEFLTANLP